MKLFGIYLEKALCALVHWLGPSPSYAKKMMSLLPGQAEEIDPQRKPHTISTIIHVLVPIIPIPVFRRMIK